MKSNSAQLIAMVLLTSSVVLLSTKHSATAQMIKQNTDPQPQNIAMPVAASAVQKTPSTADVSDTKITEMTQNAADLQSNGKLEEAQQVLIKITQLKPEDRDAFEQLSKLDVLRAQDYLKDNKFENALLLIRQALSASPNNSEASQILSDLYKKVGADPQNIKTRLSTASTLYNQKRYLEAEVEYRTSLAVQITPEAYVGLGKVSEQLEAGSGRPDFERALEVDDNCAAAHREIGQCDVREGDIVSANTELSRALILDANDTAAADDLVKLWQNQVAKLADGNSHLGLARALQLKGDLPAAQAEYRLVVQLDPANPALPAARQSFKIALVKQVAAKDFNDAKTLEAQGQIDEAYKKAAQAVGYSPENSVYAIYKGELLEKLGQVPHARRVYMKTLEYDPQNEIAAQKIRQLPADSLATAPTQMAVAPPGSPYPSSGSQQVDSISSFVGQLRDNMLGQNNAGALSDLPPPLAPFPAVPLGDGSAVSMPTAGAYASGASTGIPPASGAAPIARGQFYGGAPAATGGQIYGGVPATSGGQTYGGAPASTGGQAYGNSAAVTGGQPYSGANSVGTAQAYREAPAVSNAPSSNATSVATHAPVDLDEAIAARATASGAHPQLAVATKSNTDDILSRLVQPMPDIKSGFSRSPHPSVALSGLPPRKRSTRSTSPAVKKNVPANNAEVIEKRVRDLESQNQKLRDAIMQQHNQPSKNEEESKPPLSSPGGLYIGPASGE